MVNNLVKYVFAIVGIVTGITISRMVLKAVHIQITENAELFVIVFVALIFGVLFFSVGIKTAEFTFNGFDMLLNSVQNMSFSELGTSAVGLISGLVVANLICITINRIPIVGVPLSILINIALGAFGVFLFSTKKNEDIRDLWIRKEKEGGVPPKDKKLLDTSVIIDGRIVDVFRTGIIEGSVLVPDFILEELRHLADSEDDLKRAKGRRGLDVLHVLQNDLKVPVSIIEDERLRSASIEVDEKLLALAKSQAAKIVTNDYNLNKVAKIQEIPILNINDLANAMKPIAVSGEKMDVKVLKEGKENGQGVGYLEDGTMIVVDGGLKYKGETIKVIVTSVLQTTAGSMVFARLHEQS